MDIQICWRHSSIWGSRPFYLFILDLLAIHASKSFHKFHISRFWDAYKPFNTTWHLKVLDIQKKNWRYLDFMDHEYSRALLSFLDMLDLFVYSRFIGQTCIQYKHFNTTWHPKVLDTQFFLELFEFHGSWVFKATFEFFRYVRSIYLF